MLVFSIIAGLCLLGAMSYLALSKNSRSGIRIAALIALGVMILTVIACLIIIMSSRAAVSEAQPFSDTVMPVKPRSAGDSLLLIGCIIFLVALFMIILIQSLREQRKMKS